MSEDARTWLGLLVVVLIVMGLVSLMVSIQAHERGRKRVRRALALLWASVLGTTTRAPGILVFAIGTTMAVRSAMN